MQKFRLWDKENKVMIPWEQYKHEMVGSDLENDLLVVLPYLGLSDRNGTEIYEGDILRWDTSPIACRYDCEVIGNIYENPELLEEAE